MTRYTLNQCLVQIWGPEKNNAKDKGRHQGYPQVPLRRGYCFFGPWLNLYLVENDAVLLASLISYIFLAYTVLLSGLYGLLFQRLHFRCEATTQCVHTLFEICTQTSGKKKEHAGDQWVRTDPFELRFSSPQSATLLKQTNRSHTKTIGCPCTCPDRWLAGRGICSDFMQGSGHLERMPSGISEFLETFMPFHCKVVTSFRFFMRVFSPLHF